MAGILVPLTLIPRYSCYSGAHTFLSIGIDVSAYSSAIVNVWRSELAGTSPHLDLLFEESTDQVVWTTCTGSPTTQDVPSADTETQYTMTLRKRWFRVSIELTGTKPVVTCWAVGFLEQRES